MNIGFHHDSFSLRGVDQASYSYAEMCEEILGHKVVVVKANKEDSKWISDRMENRFRTRFNVVDYNGERRELEKIISKTGLDAMYLLNTGFPDTRFRELGMPIWNHSVFPDERLDPRVENFAVVSRWLSAEYFSGTAKFVPHIIRERSTDENMRNVLRIPRNATVVGSIGGRFNFNNRLAIDSLVTSLEKRSDLWMISLNQIISLKHDRCIVLEGSVDETQIWKFINTCDFMLHARADGETFGIACGEFCKAGKPVIAWAEAPQQAHIDQFVDKDLKYKDRSDLVELLLSIKARDFSADKEYRRVQQFNTTEVAKIFKRIFVDNENNGNINSWPVVDLVSSVKRRLKRRGRVKHAKINTVDKEEMQKYCGALDFRE